MDRPADPSLRHPPGAAGRTADTVDGAAGPTARDITEEAFTSACGGVDDAAQSGAARPAGRWARALGLYVPPAIVLVILLGTWQGITVLFNVPSYILPSPIAVAGGFATNASDLLTATYYTLRDALAGFALSIIIGVLVATVLAQSKILERAVSPYATMLQTIPIIAIAPIINLLIGANEAGVSLIAFIIAVFPIISNTTLGLTSVDHNLLNLFQM